MRNPVSQPVALSEFGRSELLPRFVERAFGTEIDQHGICHHIGASAKILYGVERCG
ncbi:hypothetical protein [Mesorhizobium ciceri]|uniref:hypothetical protein n=1 Tax=Mesorhizobium ciceri TaxID=39645 RepID=UPI0013E89F7F|nr:hypothetical protein [Mesorhizobium ciceri]